MLRLIGQALLAQHRVSGRVAVEEKPDVLWDRPDLERLYARLEDEYELKERAVTLKHKLDVIVETAHALTDIIDADRATRLEATIIVLIVAELSASIDPDRAGAARAMSAVHHDALRVSCRAQSTFAPAHTFSSVNPGS